MSSVRQAASGASAAAAVEAVRLGQRSVTPTPGTAAAAAAATSAVLLAPTPLFPTESSTSAESAYMGIDISAEGTDGGGAISVGEGGRAAATAPPNNPAPPTVYTRRVLSPPHTTL